MNKLFICIAICTLVISCNKDNITNNTEPTHYYFKDFFEVANFEDYITITYTLDTKLQKSLILRDKECIKNMYNIITYNNKNHGHLTKSKVIPCEYLDIPFKEITCTKTLFSNKVSKTIKNSIIRIYFLEDNTYFNSEVFWNDWEDSIYDINIKLIGKSGEQDFLNYISKYYNN